jgi:plastocyanin
MRRWPPLILLTLSVLAIPSALAATKTVDVTRAGFTPNKVTVDFGDTVTWTNKDNQSHQVLFDQAAWPTSPVLAQDQTYSLTFTKSGSFGYRDAFATNRRGTVTVRAGVSIKGAPAQVAYGKPSTMSGSVSSGATGEAVSLEAKPCGQTAFAKVASATSTTGGAWSAAVSPTMNTVYRAAWKNARSAELTEAVAPGLRLKRVRRGRFTASLTAAQAFTGKFVVVQRYVRTKKAWKAVKRVTLKTAKPGTAPTVVTSAGFRLRVPRRTRLRLVLTQDQAGTCYAASRSGAVRA